MTKRRVHDSVSIDIAAPPSAVYALVSDITRMGEWSPECRRCAWIGGATGPVVGARFKARNKGRRGPAWGNTPTVVTAEAGREFAFNRNGPGQGSYTWRYRLEPSPIGTHLTESYKVERPLPRAMAWLTATWVGSADRDADLNEGMQITLSRMKDAAEQAT